MLYLFTNLSFIIYHPLLWIAFQYKRSRHILKHTCTYLSFTSIHTKSMYFPIHFLSHHEFNKLPSHTKTRARISIACTINNIDYINININVFGIMQLETKSHSGVEALAHWTAECRYLIRQPVLDHVIQPKLDSYSNNLLMLKHSRINQITASWMRWTVAFRHCYWLAVHLVCSVLQSHWVK